MSNYISYVMPPADKERALVIINELKGILKFCIKLTKEQKSIMPKVDDARVPFVVKGLAFGEQEPRIVPPFTPLGEYKIDIDLYKDLEPIENGLVSLAEMIVDTRIGAGSDAFNAALSIYKSAKGAAKNDVPGTQAIVDEMSKLFAGQGNFKKPESEK